MKLRITEPGWEGYTGMFGLVEFVNGESVRDVTPFEAQRVSNVVRVRTEDGSNPSSSQLTLDARNVAMSATIEGKGIEPVQRAQAPAWTRAALEAVADKDGIEGLRKIADPLGVKSNSIAKLLDMILAAQDGQAQGEKDNYDEFLVGSGTLHSQYEFDGKTYTLGDIVGRAFNASEMTVRAWNDAEQSVRDRWLNQALEQLRAA